MKSGWVHELKIYQFKYNGNIHGPFKGKVVENEVSFMHYRMKHKLNLYHFFQGKAFTENDCHCSRSMGYLQAMAEVLAAHCTCTWQGTIKSDTLYINAGLAYTCNFTCCIYM